MLATVRLLLLLFITTLLFSCAETLKLTPEMVMKMEENKDKIIKEQLSGRKLDLVEGVWDVGDGNEYVIFKKGESYMHMSMFEERFAGAFSALDDVTYVGDCIMMDGKQYLDGDLRIISLSNDRISYRCRKENYLSKIDKAINVLSKETTEEPKTVGFEETFSRVWPEDLVEHNSQF